MIVKIIDKEKLLKENGIVNCPLKYIQEYYVVEAMDDTGYLILLFVDKLIWCSKSKSILIIDNNVESNWIFNKKYIYKSEEDMQTVIYSNLKSPEWMIKEKTFLYDIFENPSQALDIFQKYSNKKIN